MKIWITPVAGGPPIQLAPTGHTQVNSATAGRSPEDWPSWSSDGAWVAYAHANHGAWSLAKMRVGARTPPEEVASDVIEFSPVQWPPNGIWIAYNGHNGLSLVSPDGKSTRVLHEQAWMAFTWSADGQRLYGFRQSDNFQYLTLTSVDIRSGAERVLGPDFMRLPVAGQPFRGMTRISPTTFLASIERVRSDVWLLEGFQPFPTLWDRLASAVSSRKH